eukprot:gnl/TRDRNA2_/TRDRNA2_182569_c0_seq1.p1 gnl/TRDRNA2_/TRDRNA2_182569_c0~~gnl/TRDRNA2_/TRDRNA2_182569_c0_seq1.p1  ORF type:complete len:179 (+),score=36.62 gnl/TRDRNA2_/TRDRNA2_182569_c0_seq1:57-539(+)
MSPQHCDDAALASAPFSSEMVPRPPPCDSTRRPRPGAFRRSRSGYGGGCRQITPAESREHPNRIKAGKALAAALAFAADELAANSVSCYGSLSLSNDTTAVSETMMDFEDAQRNESLAECDELESTRAKAHATLVQAMMDDNLKVALEQIMLARAAPWSD